MDLREDKTETPSSFVKWQQTDGDPIVFQVMEDRGDTTYQYKGRDISQRGFTIKQVKPFAMDERTMDLSVPNGLNAFIAAQEKYGLESVAGVWWKAWRSGTGYETTFHFEIVEEPDSLPF